MVRRLAGDALFGRFLPDVRTQRYSAEILHAASTLLVQRGAVGDSALSHPATAAEADDPSHDARDASGIIRGVPGATVPSRRGR